MNIKFEILNSRSKLPSHSSIVLTTSDEIHNFINIPKKLKILSYSNEKNFDYYILKVLAAGKIGFKEKYSELTFSIDPGIKHTGLVVFLDDYYLISHTFFDNNELITQIRNYIENFQNDKQHLMKLVFKFGSGVVTTILKLLEALYSVFNNRKTMQVFLIDEFKSSKIKIRYKNIKFSKDEASALILAMREDVYGIEVNQNTYQNIIKQLPCKKKNKQENNKDNFETYRANELTLVEVAERVLDGKISLKESIKIIKNIEIS